MKKFMLKASKQFDDFQKETSKTIDGISGQASRQFDDLHDQASKQFDGLQKDAAAHLDELQGQCEEFQDQPSHQQKKQSPDAKHTLPPPTSTDVFRYRYSHGTNLGSVFVLEKWLSGSMFPSSSKGDSELDAVSASVKEIGIEATREKWEAHWRNAITDADFAWMVEKARCNSIRLPIGYFTLGEDWCRHSPFSHVGAVYANAWTAVEELEKRARYWGIGILLDFHAVYGGANGEAHSGTSSGKAELWDHKKNLEGSKKALHFMAYQVKSQRMLGVVGIQVCNEAGFDAKGMYKWYDDVIDELAALDVSIPLYISDGWDLGRCLKWVNDRHIFPKGPSNPIVIDTHRYFTFSDADRAKTPQQIISQIPQELKEVDIRSGDRGEAQLIVGEWSNVLDGQTWSRVSPNEKDNLVKQFGRAQSSKWLERTGGSYFWTYKMDWMDGGEWGFAEQTRNSNIKVPFFLTLAAQEILNRAQRATLQQKILGQKARAEHDAYWTTTSPGKKFEHHLYTEGWDAGFSDALGFFTMRANGGMGENAKEEGGDKIGFMEIWIKKRLGEAGIRGEFIWEWEQGFRAGAAAFYKNVCI